MRGHIGARHIDDVTGVDILNWHVIWSENGKHLAAAAMARAVLEAAISFGVMLRKQGCAELAVIFRETRRKLPAPRSRKAVLTAEQVIAARAAAHADGRPSCALAYALAFETTLRLWDVIGQWYPMDWREVSDIISAERKQKWLGVRWEDIDEKMRITYTPSKTATRTGATISYPLSQAPMVIEELKHWPAEKRSGPIVVSEKTGKPYRELPFQKRWQKDRKAAGIPAAVWARDLRASGITEARASDVSTDDAAKVAGHSSTRTTGDYDRAVIEATNRFAAARLRERERSGNGSGNGR
jgi:integrase